MVALDLSPGDAVKIYGLTADGLRQLNGRRGVVTKVLPESSSYEVRVSAARSETIPVSNVTPVASLPSDAALCRGVEGLDPDARAPCGYQELPFREGDAVEVFGLTSEAGRELNGKNGTVLEFDEESGRFKVRFSMGMVGNRYEYTCKLLRPGQLRQVCKNPCSKNRIGQGPRAAAAAGPASPFSRDASGGGGSGQEQGGGGTGGGTCRFAPGERVEVYGLQSESGRALNGSSGVVLRYVEATDRYEVACPDENAPKSLKGDNLRLPVLSAADLLRPGSAAPGSYL